MKREIKFRAYSFDTMRYFDYVNDMSWFQSNDGQSNGVRLSDCELMQYTGLKDKNGKEIYEGDVIPVSIITDKGVFVKNYQVYWASRGWTLHNPKTLESTNGQDLYNCEVIGNIHENPELIK